MIAVDTRAGESASPQSAIWQTAPVTTAYPLPKWRRSKSCSGGQCVEVARVDNRILMRDSKNPDVEPLAFSAAEWADFVSCVEAGQFRL